MTRINTNAPVWSLYPYDEKHVIAGKKDGSIDIINIEEAALVKSYALDIKSGVQCIARHSTNAYIFAAATMQGVCFISISPLNLRMKPVKAVLKDTDVRSIAHVEGGLWLISTNHEN